MRNEVEVRIRGLDKLERLLKRLEELNAEAKEAAEGGTVVTDCGPVARGRAPGREQRWQERVDRPHRVLAVGLDLADAHDTDLRGAAGTHFATPDESCTGHIADRIVYGPRLRALLDWHENVVLTRVKS